MVPVHVAARNSPPLGPSFSVPKVLFLHIFPYSSLLYVMASKDLARITSSSSITFWFSAALTCTGSALATLDLNSHTEFASLSKLFEAVECVSGHADVAVAAVSTGTLAAGFVVAGSLDNHDHFAESPHSKVVFLSAQTPQTLSIDLPPGHLFRHEIRATAIGNARPIFNLWVANAPATAAASITAIAYVHFQLRGVGRAA